ncbi:hypothetical protein FUA48_04950 [Flavobacterium alkalisoli]|uniref:Uncharacterized protein n=1 Tax=Flavobacterium alkalisoli TaxID=2602769 RepID=A0A5B9FRW6_9FLAO|nr:hypothetical protein [Flavobacterium alkalisoli]QEE48949.1 hypothetical protein FUA48_04950 [Flavobacterium alkalisoli]
MKKITLLLALFLVTISAYAQEKEISDIEKKQEVSIIEKTPEPLQSKDFSFASSLFKSDYNKNYTGLYFQGAKIHSTENIFSVYAEKHPEEYSLINTYNNGSRYDATDGFSLGKWNNKKGFTMNISLGGKCGL